MLAVFPAKKVCQSSTAISPTQPTPSHFRPMLFLLRLAARLPLRLLHALGAELGWMVYVFSPRYRRDFKRNLALAGLIDFHRAPDTDEVLHGNGCTACLSIS